MRRLSQGLRASAAALLLLPSGMATRMCYGAVAAWLISSRAALAQPAQDNEPDPSDDEGMPAGHPQVTGNGQAAGPHATTRQVTPGIFQPPEDTEKEDPSLPTGSISVEIRDADDRPLPHVAVTLGIMMNSVAKGESRKHIQQDTDASGRAFFGGLQNASAIAYRVSAGYDGGSYAAMPFQLAQGKAMRVVLHVYPVTRDLDDALVVSDAVVAAELRDDRLQIEEAITIYNLGRTSWVPDGVKLSLPEGFTAFNAQASMSDQGLEAVPGGARLHGTFAPGQHPLEFRWQIPWSGSADVDMDIGMPPHAAIARVMLPASASGVKLEVSGFPPADTRRDARGQSFLVTEKRVRPDSPRMSTIHVSLRGLPTPGPGKVIAAVLAALGVAAGIALALRKRPSDPQDGPDPQPILDSLLELERARAEGAVGPGTYERERRHIIDALALSLSHGGPPAQFSRGG